MVGEATFVQRGVLLLQLRLGPLSRRFQLGNAGPLLGDLGPLGTVVGGLAVLVCRLLTALAQLTLARPQPGLLACP